MLRELIRSENVKNAIIFCNRKRDVAILLKSLQKHGFNAGALHGDMDQISRTATLDAFREGRITLLAASDVAARGLDIPDVSHIFNFDVPWQSDDYVHRIGRTGRAGKEGRSLTLVTPEDIKQLKDIEKMLGAPVTWIGDPPSAEDMAERQAPARSRRARSVPSARQAATRARGGRSPQRRTRRAPASRPRTARRQPAAGRQQRRSMPPPAPGAAAAAAIAAHARTRAAAQRRRSAQRTAAAPQPISQPRQATAGHAAQRKPPRQPWEPREPRAGNPIATIAGRRRSVSAITCRRS